VSKSDTVGADRRLGEGPLARAAVLVYTLLIVELLLVLTTAPSLVLLILLDRDASNLPLAAACALPLGPALSAALYALARVRLDLTDLKPGTAFWHGYKINLAGVLRIWIPFLLVLTVLGVNLTHLDTAGVPTWWAVLLALLATATTLWAANALVVTSLFAFRAGDVARLAAYFLFHKAGVTLGTACLLVVAIGLTLISSEAVLLLFAALFAAGLLLTARPMTTEVEERFTA
jgi:hypothetical protein